MKVSSQKTPPFQCEDSKQEPFSPEIQRNARKGPRSNSTMTPEVFLKVRPNFGAQAILYGHGHIFETLKERAAIESLHLGEQSMIPFM